MNGRIDMARLAELAGVSKSTVSRALSDSPLVSKSTKQAIMALANEAGYTLNTAARNFRLGRTGVVSVVLTLEPDSTQTTSDPFFMTMIAEIAEHLRERGYNTLLSHERLTSSEMFLRSQTRQGSDGVVFIGQGKLHQTLNQLADSKLPMVVWGADLPDRRYPVVGSDNEQGGYLACEHLLSKGCQAIGFLGDLDYPEPELRYSGYCRSLKGTNFTVVPPSSVPSVSFDPSQSREVVRDYLLRNPQLDGLVCCSDTIAIAAVSVIQELGKRVPEDIAVVGYDNLLIAELTHPRLTSIDQNVSLGAKRLCDALFEQMDEKIMSRDDMSEARLIVRASA